jgi:tRNA-splicing ligase RtcB
MEKVNDKFYNWASILEWDTREQARVTASMPFIYPHLALMPDAHLGKGATVGSVIPTRGAIMPAAVGVDIGCGMMAVKTQFFKSDLREKGLPKLHAAIASAIPLSAGNYNQTVRKSANNRIKELEKTPGIESAERIAPTWTRQLGSLGSGNHFIEISLDENDQVWLFLHSGSRGVGNKLATAHIKIAQSLCEGEKLPNKDLAYLEEDRDAELFWDYITDLRWAQKFALLNRAEMMDRVVECFEDFVNSDVRVLEEVNCHHNYTERVNLGGIPNTAADEDCWIWLSRKGAINAELGTPGLIPGSMGDKSYVVEGLGNPMALWSAPHGAGRKLSRSKAKDKFTLDDLTKRMNGIAWGESKSFLDEHPLAYKDIDQVMLDAQSLVISRHVLRQIVNVKGN